MEYVRCTQGEEIEETLKRSLPYCEIYLLDESKADRYEILDNYFPNDGDKSSYPLFAGWGSDETPHPNEYGYSD